jgi:hypothetical protein
MTEGRRAGMTTEERLDALERELTRAKRLLVVAGLIAIALALIWTLTKTTPVAQAQQADAVPKEVRASRFVLEDEEGVAHAMLAMYEGNPWLQLGGESGIAHASMTVANGEPTLVLKDKDGKTRVLLNGSADMPGLQLHDENGERRAWLSMIEGTPILGLCDPGVEQAAERRTRAVSLTVMAANPGWGLMLSEGDKT